MSPKKPKVHKKLWLGLLIAALIITAVSYSFYAYANNYYHTVNSAKTSLISSAEVAVESLEDEALVFTPKRIKHGLIFYPGAKVEYTAYAPLLHKLAEQGFLCILPKMPYNMAIFDSNAADKYKEKYPDIEGWYMAGHSMGGAMAASYISKHADEFDGLILLAAYSTKDISESNLNVISLYGSEDQVINRDNYEKYRAKLPDSLHEMIIDGGCHAYFGCYGYQKGDGQPTITNAEQIETTVDFICSSIND